MANENSRAVQLIEPGQRADELDDMIDEEPGYEGIGGAPKFTPESLQEHARYRTKLFTYVSGSRLLVFLTSPLLYICIAPLTFSDLAVTIYQAVCFPIYGIPKVRRADFFVFDRHRLKYLNLIERFNCLYCSYATGRFAYEREIAARTEQHWCPIKHATRIEDPHTRYSRFLEFGAPEAYRTGVETLRRDFSDISPGSTPELERPCDQNPVTLQTKKERRT
jgi:hypothetical protein